MNAAADQPMEAPLTHRVRTRRHGGSFAELRPLLETCTACLQVSSGPLQLEPDFCGKNVGTCKTDLWLV